MERVLQNPLSSFGVAKKTNPVATVINRGKNIAIC